MSKTIYQVKYVNILIIILPHHIFENTSSQLSDSPASYLQFFVDNVKNLHDTLHFYLIGSTLITPYNLVLENALYGIQSF